MKEQRPKLTLFEPQWDFIRIFIVLLYFCDSYKEVLSVAAIGAVGAASYVLYQKQEEKIRLLEKRLEKLTEKVKENDLIGKISNIQL